MANIEDYRFDIEDFIDIMYGKETFEEYCSACGVYAKHEVVDSETVEDGCRNVVAEYVEVQCCNCGFTYEDVY